MKLPMMELKGLVKEFSNRQLNSIPKIINGKVMASGKRNVLASMMAN